MTDFSKTYDSGWNSESQVWKLWAVANSLTFPNLAVNSNFILEYSSEIEGKPSINNFTLGIGSS